MSKQHFQAHETARVDGLYGVPLAKFWQRALGFVIDLLLMLCVWSPVVLGWRYFVSHQTHGSTNLELNWIFEDDKSLLFLLADGVVAVV